jgi:hypothetical protein
LETFLVEARTLLRSVGCQLPGVRLLASTRLALAAVAYRVHQFGLQFAQLRAVHSFSVRHARHAACRYVGAAPLIVVQHGVALTQLLHLLALQTPLLHGCEGQRPVRSTQTGPSVPMLLPARFCSHLRLPSRGHGVCRSASETSVGSWVL